MFFFNSESLSFLLKVGSLASILRYDHELRFRGNTDIYTQIIRDSAYKDVRLQS